MKSPVISVVIPCYNQAEFLGECRGSVLGRMFVHYSLIKVGGTWQQQLGQ